MDRGVPTDRTGLQDLGDELDERMDYRWPLDNVALPAMAADPSRTRWLLDSVRKAPQIERFRAALGGTVIHAHFTASEEILRARYNARLAAGDDYIGVLPYEEAIRHANEASSRAIGAIAQIIVDSGAASPAALAAELMRRIAALGGHVPAAGS